MQHTFVEQRVLLLLLEAALPELCGIEGGESHWLWRQIDFANKQALVPGAYARAAFGARGASPAASGRGMTAIATAVLVFAAALALGDARVPDKVGAATASGAPWTGAGAGPPPPVDVSVVNVVDALLSFQDQLAVQACAGLVNRKPEIYGAAYVVLKGQTDWDWLADVRKDGWIGAVRNETVPAFLTRCLSSSAAAGYIRFNYSEQHLVVPQIITAAGALSAVPLEDGSPYIGSAARVLDAVAVLGSNSTLRDATMWAYGRFVNATSTLAFMDPGFTGSDPLAPVLTRDPNPSLVDLIVKERMFNMYMVEACIPDTADYALMERIATGNPWPRPIAVFGYDDTFKIFGGDLFEAETSCVKAHNMGQVATDSASNLAFFSIPGPITEPVPQNPRPAVAFNASRTYLAITVGDGDNMSFLQSSRRSWMQQRVTRCRADPSGCFPLLWSISPHTLRKAPGWLRWFYAQANATGKDWFVLPPSGHLYAYPSQMPDGPQAAFVSRTEEDAQMLSTSATVAWEFALTWQEGIDRYFPRYSEAGVVSAFFAVNVPFMLPVLPFLDGEFFKVLGNRSNVVLFRPREWRGTDATKAPPLSGREYLTAVQMADEVNGYPPGTATQIYVTSDGGASFDTIASLVPLLGEHVQLVDDQAIAAMALASHAHRGGAP